MLTQSDVKKLRYRGLLCIIQRLQIRGGFWFPTVQRRLKWASEWLSIGNLLNRCLEKKSLDGPWVSEFYQFIIFAGGSLWLFLIEQPYLTNSVWRKLGAGIALYRPFEILLFCLSWILVQRFPVVSHRRSLISFIFHLIEIGIFFTIAFLLLDWFEPSTGPEGILEALLLSIFGTFSYESFEKVASNDLPQIFWAIKALISWILVVVILGNVVSSISRGEIKYYSAKRRVAMSHRSKKRR